METEILKIAGTVAGIGGLGVGVVLLIYKDFLTNFIKAKVFRTLSSLQSTILLGATVAFTFSIAVLGIFAGFFKEGGAISFISLVVIILLFLFAVFYFLTKTDKSGQAIPKETDVFFNVHNLLAKSKIDDAEKELGTAANLQKNSAEFWYWKARIAFARGNEKGALVYIDEALKREQRHACSLSLKIKLLLFSGDAGDRVQAKDLAEKSYGISDSLDIWLNCLKSENMFSLGIRTIHELELRCHDVK